MCCAILKCLTRESCNNIAFSLSLCVSDCMKSRVIFIFAQL
jgi:hypothetical protein